MKILEIWDTMLNTITHEIIHCYLEESGLGDNSGVYNYGWAVNEEMVDWFAIQWPKIAKTREVVEKWLYKFFKLDTLKKGE